MNFIKDMWSDGWIGKSVLLLMVTVILLIPVSIYYGIQESEQWERFKVSHNCKVVGHEKGHTSTGIAPIVGGNGGVGVIITQTPNKTGWLCDDGVTYWR